MSWQSLGGPAVRWKDLVFNAGDFAASGGGNSWNIVAGNVLTYHWAQLGQNVAAFEFVSAGFTVTGAPSALFINMPKIVQKNTGAWICFGNPTGFANGLQGYCLPVNPGVTAQMRFQLANTGGSPTWSGASEMFCGFLFEVNF